MNKKIFLYMYNIMERREKLKLPLVYISKALVSVVMLLYYGAVLYLAVNLDKRIFPFVLLPYAVLISVKSLRNRLNRPRPYDELPVTPLGKHKAGRSFPSCHASSAAAIAAAFWYLYMPVGIFITFLAVLICLTRILMGMHYPRDVFWGAFIGFASGWFFYFVILRLI